MQNSFGENQFGGPSHPVSIPNSTAVLVLGIVSFVGCFCYGVPGIVLGIIGLVLSNKARAEYNAAPDRYTEASLKNLNAGRICAIVGLVLSVLATIGYIVYFVVIFEEVSRNPYRFRY